MELKYPAHFFWLRSKNRFPGNDIFRRQQDAWLPVWLLGKAALRQKWSMSHAHIRLFLFLPVILKKTYLSFRYHQNIQKCFLLFWKNRSIYMICIHFWQSFLQSLIFRLAGLLQVKQHISRNTAASILKASDRLFFYNTCSPPLFKGVLI